MQNIFKLSPELWNVDIKNMRILFSLLALSALLSLKAQPIQKLPPGFPDRSPGMDALPGFRHPPKGYGEVSFYWWIGDTLTHERIIWQLEQLKNKGITGLQINYCHTDKGGASYGLTFPSQPALFSDKWWELFQWFLKEAKKRDMSVSLSDYTLGAAGQGWFVDEMLKENPQIHGAKLEAKQFDVQGTKQFIIQLPTDVISAIAYQEIEGGYNDNKQIDLKKNILDSKLSWQVPEGKWKIIVVYKTTVQRSFDPMNPLSGAKVIEKFYQRFEDYCPGEAGKGLNFFFSDELQFGIRGFLWNDTFAAEFKNRKGYDILPELPHLFANLGPRSYKIRMDYNDVMVSLSEDGFFKPVYNWHNSRGMLFGCDHGGRGRDVTEFGDYFRTQRWMSGPGCDQPGLGKDIVKDKVASSITHLYERPRTWLEGFYGSGWGTSSEEVADATFANFAMGQNLLSLHGLYYSTHGSWWEWAAPDNHWRQPYWQNMGSFLQCTERLSYVLSQGHHRCDVAIVYPVAPTEANLNGKESTQTAFSMARDLYPNGIDFDFMDFESLNRSTIQNRELNVSGEKYKVLVLPYLSAVRYSTVEKALDFFRTGGIVLAVGGLPEASDRIGGNDPQLQAMLREMFGTTAKEKHDTTVTYSQKNSSGGKGIFLHDPLLAKSIISGLFQPDFKVLSGNTVPGLLHRKIGNRDLYFVYGLPKGTSCFFRATGKVEIWNPWNGATQLLKVDSLTENGTILKLPMEKSEPQLIVFSPGKARVEDIATSSKSIFTKTDTLNLGNSWEFGLRPLLDNQFGDYRLPAYTGKIGVEVWKMKFAEEKSDASGWQNPALDDSKWSEVSVGFGPQFYKLGPLQASADSTFDASTLAASADSGAGLKLAALQSIDVTQPVEIGGKKYFWQPYEFSWRWGLKDDAGHQGYHGLKGVVNNDLISLGTIDKSSKYRPVYPLKAETEGSVYYLWSTVAAPEKMQAKILQSGLLPVQIYVNNIPAGTENVELNSGNNPVLLKYDQVGRGAVVFMKSKGDPNGKQADPNRKQAVPLASVWYQHPDVLPFDCLPGAAKSFGWYRFQSPPGASTMYITSKSTPEVWVAGKAYKGEAVHPSPERVAEKEATTWKIDFQGTIPESSVVAVRIEQMPGYNGGAALPEPILFDCGKGKIRLGDLGQTESLRNYSGGLIYRKSITLNASQANAKKITLDLGNLVASAEVTINGKPAGSRIIPPWNFDLTGRLKPGQNQVEILIYNTLGNHYLTTPSQYIGSTVSGLIGPVKLRFQP